MPMPDLSRRSTIALVAVVAGVVAITVALLSGSGSSDRATNPAPGSSAGIDPVAPLDESQADANPKKRDPLLDVTDPFSGGFGITSKHKVVVRLSAGGGAQAGIRYRDEREEQRTFTSGYTATRTIKSQFPIVMVGIQNFPGSSSATCTIEIDGVKVSSNSTKEPYGVVICSG